MSKTLYDKLSESRVVRDYGDGSALLYVGRDLSPRGFHAAILSDDRACQPQPAWHWRR